MSVKAGAATGFIQPVAAPAFTDISNANAACTMTVSSASLGSVMDISMKVGIAAQPIAAAISTSDFVAGQSFIYLDDSASSLRSP